MKYLILILFTITLAASCKNDQSTDSASTDDTPSRSNAMTSKDPRVQNTMQLLQGTWNSRDDKHTSIIIKDNTRQETRNGKNLGKMRYFELADQCNNDTAKGHKVVKVEARFISMLDIDMCYYIKKINKKELILSYVGRDGDLRYKKSNGIMKNKIHE